MKHVYKWYIDFLTTEERELIDNLPIGLKDILRKIQVDGIKEGISMVRGALYLSTKERNKREKKCIAIIGEVVWDKDLNDYFMFVESGYFSLLGFKY